jgi:hypothetical protein
MMDSETGTIDAMLIPPRILEKGQLITGSKYDFSKGPRPKKIAVPAGEDGSFLQADSTMETGLKWVKIAMPTPDEQYKKALEDEVMLQRQQIDALVKFLRPQIDAIIEQKKQETNGQSVFFVRLYGVDYRVPYDGTMTIRDVINYLNTTYFIILSPDCAGLRLTFGGEALNEKKTISDANIMAESTVIANYLPSSFPQIVGSRLAGDAAAAAGAAGASAAGKGGKSRRPNKPKKRSKNTKRSKR